MAEAVGLTMGSAGLAGVCSACMEAFSLLDASQSRGRDFEILMTWLDIEKTFLLHWAEPVGFLGDWNIPPARDTRMNHPQTHAAAANALSCGLRLLADSERLCSEYEVIMGSPISDPP